MSERNDAPEEREELPTEDLELKDDDADKVVGGDIVITKQTDVASPKL